MCVAAIAPIIGLAGAVVQGIGAANDMGVQQQQAEMQAELQRREARVQRDTSVFEAQRTQDKIDRTLGAQRAGFTANGINLSGSAADVMDDSATEGALDVAAIRWNSAVRENKTLFESRISDYNAAAAGRARPLAFIGPVISGAARFAGAFEGY